MPRLIPILAALISGAGCSSDPCGSPRRSSDLPAGHVLLQPDAPALQQVPPHTFDARFETTKGDVVVRVVRDWAPLGAARFYNLAANGFYEDNRIFRVLPGFVAQFGMNGRPDVDDVWDGESLTDDPPREPNRAGTLVFATRGPDTRATQLFFNYIDNPQLDALGFVPFGRVTQGMDVLERLHSGYGELQPEGAGPVYECIQSHGNSYLDAHFPELDRVRRVILE